MTERKPGSPAQVYDRPARPLAPPETAPTPVWVGWVAALTPDGVVRRKVRLPATVLGTFSTPDSYPPNHRSTVALQVQDDMMADAFLEELSKAKEGR